MWNSRLLSTEDEILSNCRISTEDEIYNEIVDCSLLKMRFTCDVWKTIYWRWDLCDFFSFLHSPTAPPPSCPKNEKGHFAVKSGQNWWLWRMLPSPTHTHTHTKCLLPFQHQNFKSIRPLSFFIHPFPLALHPKITMLSLPHPANPCSSSSIIISEGGWKFHHQRGRGGGGNWWYTLEKTLFLSP